MPMPFADGGCLWPDPSRRGAGQVCGEPCRRGEPFCDKHRALAASDQRRPIVVADAARQAQRERAVAGWVAALDRVRR